MMGEFDSVMQIRDKVQGLHNFGEFSQPLSVYKTLVWPHLLANNCALVVY